MAYLAPRSPHLAGRVGPVSGAGAAAARHGTDLVDVARDTAVEIPPDPSPDAEGPGGGTGAVPLLPGPATAARRARFVLATMCTVASLSLGVVAILLAMHGEVRTAALCLIGCVIFDGLDGALARCLGVSSAFGAQMDSMADMCAFGVAAPVVLYASLAGTALRPGAAIAGALMAACAAVRLARFTITARDPGFFRGVPTTAAAAVLALAVLMELPLPATAQLAGMAVLAFAMVSRFPYPTIDRLRQLPAWLWLVPLGGAVVNPTATFLVLVGAYLASGPLLWWRQRRTA